MGRLSFKHRIASRSEVFPWSLAPMRIETRGSMKSRTRSFTERNPSIQTAFSLINLPHTSNVAEVYQESLSCSNKSRKPTRDEGLNGGIATVEISQLHSVTVARDLPKNPCHWHLPNRLIPKGWKAGPGLAQKQMFLGRLFCAFERMAHLRHIGVAQSQGSGCLRTNRQSVAPVSSLFQLDYRTCNHDPILVYRGHALPR